VSERYFGKLTDREIRLASAFAGGVGGTEQDLCGVVSMGVAVISMLYGRTSPEEDSQECLDLAASFRQRFLDKFGTVRCHDLRESGYGGDNAEPCSTLAERGVQVLVEVIDGHRASQAG
jgi:C_GCAxxG_C_C family probable redox protein